MDWHPIQGGVEILLVASCQQKPEIRAGLMGRLWPVCRLYLPYLILSTCPPWAVIFFLTDARSYRPISWEKKPKNRLICI